VSNTIVVGGGIAGLTAALRLVDAGDDVTVVDAEKTIGGLTRPWQIGDARWDRFYHVVLPGDRNTKALLERIGLADQLVFHPVETGLFTGSRLYPFSGMRDFLRFPELSLIDKLRLILTVLHARFGGDEARHERERIIPYLTRWSGANAVKKIWRPLLRAKLGDEYAYASAEFIRATMRRLQGSRRGGVRQECYGFVRGGYATVLAALERYLRSRGVNFVLGERVRSVTVDRDIVSVTLGETRLSGDRAILTLPSPLCAKLCPQLRPSESHTLSQEQYFGVVCVSLLVKKKLGDAYVTNVSDPLFPFTGVINMSALVGREHFGGRDLVYLPKYVNDPQAFAEPDDAIVQRAIRSLSRLFPELQAADVAAARVARAPHVFAFPGVGRADKLPLVRTSLGRVAIVNNARLRYATLNVSDTIGVVDDALAQLSTDVQWNAPREAERCALS
jgi:protoporphyrinogen oxidase